MSNFTNYSFLFQSILVKRSSVSGSSIDLQVTADSGSVSFAELASAKVENFITTNQVPGRICSHLIVLDENGEIARFRASSHGGNLTGSSEEEIRQFEAEQAAKRKRREEYALKRKLQEQQEDEQYYKSSITKKTVSAAYEANVLAETVIGNASLLG